MTGTGFGMDLTAAIEMLTGPGTNLATALLAAAAFLEYVFPPFPGDTVTLAGAILVTGYGFSATRVMVAVVLGSLAGAALDFLIGTAVARAISRARAREDDPRPAWLRLRIVQSALRGTDRVSRAFARHGEAYIAVNRFLPGIRAFLFVAAGMAGLRFGRVMLWAAVSAVAWNLLLLGVGMALGSRLDAIETVFRDYGIAVWTLLALVAVGAWIRHRRRRRRS